MYTTRVATEADLPAITTIYNEAILTTTATFDTEAKTAAQQAEWFQAHDTRHPVLVAELDGVVVGWACLSAWSDRPAYRLTAESSCYVAGSYRGQGIGRGLWQAIIDEASRLGFHSLIARIAAGNDASLHLSQQLGFTQTGTLREAGCKFGKLLDVHILQIMLKPGPPDVDPTLDEIQLLTGIILNEGAPASFLRPEVLRLGQLISESTPDAFSKQSEIASGETVTPDGLAVSPTMAAMCLDEYLRTVTFVRGLHQAIVDARKEISDRPVKVLYAGCGPWATLAVPIMSVMEATDVSFTLLDMHRASIDSAQAIIKALGLGDRVESLQQIDAGTYQIDPASPPDVIVLEIMQNCLDKEPQVPVSRHLISQAPDAILVPEEIRIDLTLMDPAVEFSPWSKPEDKKVTLADRIHIGKAFALTRETIASWSKLDDDRLPGDLVEVPDCPARYQPMLITTICVRGVHKLDDHSCGLTSPVYLPLDNDRHLREGDRIQFHYQLGNNPGLRFEMTSI